MNAADERLPPRLDLRLTQESAEDLYEQAPCGYCSCLPDGTLVKLNHTLLTWLGYAREELVARRTLSYLLTLGGALHFEMHGMPLLLLQGHVRELSYLLRRQDGTVQPVLLTATLVRDADGSPLVVRVMLFDITDRRQYELELLRAKQLADEQRAQLALANAALTENNALLTRTNADLDAFVYTASHDLKAPISNIEGLLLALRQQLPPAALQADMVPRLLDMMQGSVARFQQTIGHLTDISQLQMPDAPETVDLAAVIAGVCLDLAPLIEAAPADVGVAVAGCQAVRVAPNTLRSVVFNLLSNAVKYRAPERPVRVRLRAHCAAGRLVLAVQDNGLGLSNAQQSELFGLFRRLHTHVEGSGVGLFTVKRLVENAGGTVTVDSQPGVGSTFTVTLPA